MMCRKKFILMLILIGFLISGGVLFGQGIPVATPTIAKNFLPRGENIFFNLLSAGMTASANPHDSRYAPSGSLYNPASGVLRPQMTLELSAMILGGKGMPFIAPQDSLQPIHSFFGDFVSFGISIPSSVGTFTFSAHHLLSLSTAMPSRHQGLFGGSWAMPVMDQLAVGVGLKGGVSSALDSNDLLWAVAADIGLIWLPSQSLGVKDFFFGFAFQNIGWGTLPEKGTWLPLFTPSLGFGFSFYQKDDTDLRFAMNVAAPSFSSVEMKVGFDFSFIDCLTLSLSSTMATGEFVSFFMPEGQSPSYASFYPSIAFRYSYSNQEKIDGSKDAAGFSIAASTRAVTDELWGTGINISTHFGTSHESLIYCDYNNLVIDYELMKEPTSGYVFSYYDEKYPNSDDIEIFLVPGSSNINLSQLLIPLRNYGDEEMVSFTLKVKDKRRVIFTEKFCPFSDDSVRQEGDLYWITSIFDENELSYGIYTLEIETRGTSGKIYRTQRVSFYYGDLNYISIDNRSELQTIFNPMMRNEPFLIEHSGAVGDWYYEIKNNKDEIVFTGDFLRQEPKTVSWAGRNNLGQELPDGIYSYRIFSRDLLQADRNPESEVFLEATVNRVLVDSRSPLIFMDLESEKLIHGDRMMISPYLSQYDSIVSWYYEIIDESSSVVFSSSVVNAVPGHFEFDGKDNDGNYLNVGDYRAIIFVSLDNGNVRTGISDSFRVLIEDEILTE